MLILIIIGKLKIRESDLDKRRKNSISILL